MQQKLKLTKMKKRKTLIEMKLNADGFRITSMSQLKKLRSQEFDEQKLYLSYDHYIAQKNKAMSITGKCPELYFWLYFIEGTKRNNKGRDRQKDISEMDISLISLTEQETLEMLEQLGDIEK